MKMRSAMFFIISQDARKLKYKIWRARIDNSRLRLAMWVLVTAGKLSDFVRKDID